MFLGNLNKPARKPRDVGAFRQHDLMGTVLANPPGSFLPWSVSTWECLACCRRGAAFAASGKATSSGMSRDSKSDEEKPSCSTFLTFFSQPAELTKRVWSCRAYSLALFSCLVSVHHGQHCRQYTEKRSPVSRCFKPRHEPQTRLAEGLRQLTQGTIQQLALLIHQCLRNEKHDLRASPCQQNSWQHRKPACILLPWPWHRHPGLCQILSSAWQRRLRRASSCTQQKD